jgi:Copper type II ascorbate-dependent monooxygenase, C-terminal domain
MRHRNGRAVTKPLACAGSLWLLSGFLGLGMAARGAEPPTFTRDIAPILQKRCQSCHRPGQMGPFPLETYEQARKRSKDLANVASEASMPPWKPSAGVGPKLKHDPSLTAAEVATLKAWSAAGAPKGNAAHMPAPVKHPEGWALGTPDVVLEAAEPFTLPASGGDLYRCFVIPTNLPTDVYISAVEYRPSNTRVVHHMQAFLDVSGGGRERDAADPGPGYTSFSGAGVDIIGDLGGWTPGNSPTRLPEGVGRLIPRGADLIVQVHYHPDGRPETDRTKVGIYLSKGPVRQTLHWANATNYDFKLPPGKKEVEVKATWYVPVDVDALAVTPHMHALGRDARLSVTYPNGRTADLIHIGDWDPAWQNTYYFETPVTLPKGSIVKMVAHFDNSSHARNPNRPPMLVKTGQESTDEMCVAYIGVIKRGQDLTRPGEKDDLFEIFTRQLMNNMIREQNRKELRRYERSAR